MFKGKKIGVVVPAYNEEKLISKVIDNMPSYVDYIIAVDDASNDNTFKILEELKEKENNRLIVIKHTTNKGVGASIITGYNKALALDLDIVAVMAGDGQMNPEELKDIINPIAIEECDYTKGNRLFSGEAWKMIPKLRYIGNAFLSLLTKIASGYWHIADSQAGFTAISKKALKTLRLERLYPRYGYPNHLLVKLNVYNFKVKDIPVTPIYNVGEKSSMKIYKIIPTISWLLLKGFFWRITQKYIIRDFHPLVFFYFFGLFLFPFGVLWGAFIIFSRIFVYHITSHPDIINSSPLLDSRCFFLLCGLIWSTTRN